jgi:SAM-dependent methyltransferase
MADLLFEHPRLAQVYDPLDPDRSDLDVYAAMVDGFGARSVLDIGCGTGTFACLLAARGIDVTAVDPEADPSRLHGPNLAPTGYGGCSAKRPRCPQCGSMPPS